MIVDDHAVVRSGLSAFLLAFDDLEYAGEATGGADAVRKCVSLKQDDLVQGALKAGALSHLMKKPGQTPAALRSLQSRRD